MLPASTVLSLNASVREGKQHLTQLSVISVGRGALKCLNPSQVHKSLS